MVGGDDNSLSPSWLAWSEGQQVNSRNGYGQDTNT